MSATFVPPPTQVSELLRRASSSCVSVTPGKDGYLPPGTCDAIYDYKPSTPLAAAFILVFLLTTVSHVFLAFFHKKGFCWVVIMGSLWELGAFVFRALSTKKQNNKNLYIDYFMLFSLAPLWINAFVFMSAGRLFFCFLPDRRVFGLKATSIGKMFVCGDILSFFIQAGGAFLTGPGVSAKAQKMGLHVYQAGIGVQQVFICIFLALVIGFMVKMNKLKQAGHRDPHNRNWARFTWALLFVLLLITIRIIYRLVEYLVGLSHNPLLNHEFYMYVLDAVPMTIALVALAVFHPGRTLVGPGSNYRAEKKEWKLETKAAKKQAKAGHNPAAGAPMHARNISHDDHAAAHDSMMTYAAVHHGASRDPSPYRSDPRGNAYYSPLQDQSTTYGTEHV